MPPLTDTPSEVLARNGCPVRRRSSGLRFSAGLSLPIVLVSLLANTIFARELDRLAWPVQELREKWTLALSVAEEGGTDILFLGASHTAKGIDSDFVAKQLKTPLGEAKVFNAGVSGQPLSAAEVWGGQVLAPLLTPRVALIGVTPVDLHDDWTVNNPNFANFMESPVMDWRGPESDVQKRIRILSRRLAHLARNPYTVIRRTVRDEHRPSRLVYSSTGVSPHTERPGTYDPVLIQDRPNPFVQPFLTDASTGALRRLIDALKAQSVDIVIVAMPIVEQDLANELVGDRQDVLSYRRHLDSIAHRFDVPVWRADQHFQAPEFFADPAHLNTRGRRALSLWLADRLATSGLL